MSCIKTDWSFAFSVSVGANVYWEYQRKWAQVISSKIIRLGCLYESKQTKQTEHFGMVKTETYRHAAKLNAHKLKRSKSERKSVKMNAKLLKCVIEETITIKRQTEKKLLSISIRLRVRGSTWRQIHPFSSSDPTHSSKQASLPAIGLIK